LIEAQSNALATAINRALEDSDVADRFVAMPDFGPWAAFVFAIPFALRAAASELGLVRGDEFFGSA
jgi:hypothetical protein